MLFKKSKRYSYTKNKKTAVELPRLTAFLLFNTIVRMVDVKYVHNHTF